MPWEVHGVMVVKPYVCSEGGVYSTVVCVLLCEWAFECPCCFCGVCWAVSHDLVYSCVVVICVSFIGVKVDEVVWFWGFMDSDYKGVVVCMVGGEYEDSVVKSWQVTTFSQ